MWDKYRYCNEEEGRCTVQVCYTSANISEIVQDRDIVTMDNAC